MKVAFFQPYLANWRIEFLDYFIKNSGFDVIVYDGGFGGSKDLKSVSGNKVPFEYTRFYSFSPEFRIGGQPYPVYFSPFLFFKLLRDRPDVVVTEGEINFINNISVQFYCFLFKKKFVWWSLGKVRTRKKNIVNALLDPVINFQIRGCSCIMARNNYARDYYISSNLKSPDKIIVAPNSMNNHKAHAEIDPFRIEELKEQSKGKKVILYVGALTAPKRPDDLLASFVRVLELEKDSQLWIVGDGPERRSLEQRSIELGIEQGVIFFGKIFDGVGNFFSVANVVVVPGLGGLVINHAMIFGCPVVSRMADGTELDLVKDGITGYLLDDYDNDKLADAILKVLDSDRNEVMSQNSRALVGDKWNIDIMLEQAKRCVLL